MIGAAGGQKQLLVEVINFPISSMNKPTPTPDAKAEILKAHLFEKIKGTKVAIKRSKPPQRTWAK